jgi:transposase
MARAYSLDLRERVVASVGDGQSSRQVARLFRVSVASVVKWAQRSRVTGSPAAKPMGGRPGVSKLDGERSWLLARLKEKPDLTLHALLAELRDRGVTVSCDTLWRFLRSAGISFKKNRVRQRAGST